MKSMPLVSTLICSLLAGCGSGIQTGDATEAVRRLAGSKGVIVVNVWANW